MFKKLAAQKSSAPERLSAEAGAHTFHVLNSNGVAFLTLAERSYPKKLAFQYLDELANEFNRLYGGQQMENVSRPYAFIKFGAVLFFSRDYTSCSTTLSTVHVATQKLSHRHFSKRHLSECISRILSCQIRRFRRLLAEPAIVWRSCSEALLTFHSALKRPPLCRHIHSEDKEVVSGHQNATEHYQAADRCPGGGVYYDAQHR